MAAERSILPEKAQVPAALVLGALFILLLIWRFGGDSKPQAATAAVAVPTGEVSVKIDRTAELNDLTNLINDLQRIQSAATVSAAAPPKFHGDPIFGFYAATAVGSTAGGSVPAGEEGAAGGEVTASVGFDRAQKLSEMKLMGISSTLTSSVALINGRIVRQGEYIAGFFVEEITESEVVLSDTLGTERIRLPEVMGL